MKQSHCRILLLALFSLQTRGCSHLRGVRLGEGTAQTTQEEGFPPEPRIPVSV